MRLIRGLLDRLILVAGTLTGGTTPSFIAQYRQRIGGHLDQVTQNLDPFRQIATQRHEGSLKALVQHHLNSQDQTFHAEGAAIQAMIDDEHSLIAALEALTGGLHQQLWYILRHANPEILQRTWEAYEPSFVFSFESLIWAGLTGISAWLLFLGLWGTVAYVFRPRVGA